MGGIVAFRHYVFCFAIGATPAASLANWQWTKWGMSVEEVAAASDGKASPYEGDSRAVKRELLRGSYSTLGMDFTATFGFNRTSGGLSVVQLRLNSPTLQQCVELQHAMKDVYGEPLEDKLISKIIDLRVLKWRDEKAGNRVLMLMDNSSCSLQYTPTVDREGSGL
jgi:hypothetical protein